MLVTPRPIFVSNLVLAAAATLAMAGAAVAAPTRMTAATPIQHVIFIMQENRSFDHYFGTFPGANGFPAGVCVPISPSDPGQGCVAPFHDVHDMNSGGPHNHTDAIADLDDGVTTTKMDGFVARQLSYKGGSKLAGEPDSAKGSGNGFAAGIARHDVMGYHTAAEIPNYWAYAANFVLQDNMFANVRSYSLTSHLYMVSEWAAVCNSAAALSSCTTSLDPKPKFGGSPAPYPWANLFQLMDNNGVSWKYYLATGQEPDCEDGEMTCAPQMQNDGILSFWNPLPGFTWIRQQGASYLSQHNPALDQFLVDVRSGTLPQVSWIIPSQAFSEHPFQRITTGMEYVTSLVNAVMQSPYWANTAIFIAWDDWGGFYDHVVPPNVDTVAGGTAIEGWGERVPGLLISAYARPGYIDHSVLSFDSYATLIEDLFMNSERLDPAAMGQPDARPTIRDELMSVTYPGGATAPIGRLINEFDFSEAALPPLVLSTHIPLNITVSCGSAQGHISQDCTTTTVTLKWSNVAGKEVSGPFTYYVVRDGGQSPVCSTTGTSCIDASPGAGVHYYSVYSVDQFQVASPQSAAAEADVP